jgi:hypothetical protein
MDRPVEITIRETYLCAVVDAIYSNGKKKKITIYPKVTMANTHEGTYNEMPGLKDIVKDIQDSWNKRWKKNEEDENVKRNR